LAQNVIMKKDGCGFALMLHKDFRPLLEPLAFFHVSCLISGDPFIVL